MTEILANEAPCRLGVLLVPNTTEHGTNYYTLHFRRKTYVVTPRDNQTNIESATMFFRCYGIRILGWGQVDTGYAILMPYNSLPRLQKIFGEV
jgi:hypothetical protein